MECSSPFYAVKCLNFDSLEYLLPNHKVMYPDLSRFYNPKHKVLRIPFDLYSVLPPRIRPSFKEIGCGQCLGCRLSKARDWSNRVWLESHPYPNKYFLTLTYDDDSLPFIVDDKTGECKSTLCKPDLVNFMKRFRKEFGSGIRCFAAGEYGSADYTERPHYHAILWNLPELKDLKHYSGFGDQTLFLSDKVADIWGNGYVTIGSVSPDSVAYTCRYIIKKQTSPKDSLSALSLDRESEFSYKSRMPGIARDYYDSFYHEFKDTGKIILPYAKKGGTYSVRPPEYFKRLFKQNHNYDEAFISERERPRERSTANDLQARKDHEAALLRKVNRSIF